MKNFIENPAPFLAAFLVVSCMSFLFMSGFFPVKNDQALIAVTGTLSMIVGFYFGATFKEIINKIKDKDKNL